MAYKLEPLASHHSGEWRDDAKWKPQAEVAESAAERRALGSVAARAEEREVAEVDREGARWVQQDD